jgi:hypothetical protein
VLVTGADIRKWLPGDNLYDDRVFIPWDMPAGEYDLQIGMIDPLTSEPAIHLAIEGKDIQGWYTLGQIKIEP